MNTQQQVTLIEELAANAWPAPVQQRLSGWLLRYANGVTMRGNSVLAVGPEPRSEDWFGVISDFYGRRELPVRFSISDASPPGLDATLGGMGYTAAGYTSVQTAQCAPLLQRAAVSSAIGIEVSESLHDSWIDLFLLMGSKGAPSKATYRQILGNIAPRKAFATATINGESVGTGMAVVERGWTGLFTIATAEIFRGRGVATAIVGALAQWGQQYGAENLYLQVMKSNTPAYRLYAKLGFTHLYSYHFRSLDEKN